MDERPPIWVGHIVLPVSQLERSAAWWESIGMRPVTADEHVSIFELRGGTHMVMLKGTATPGDAPFDLMVDDLEASHTAYASQGLAPSDITHGDIHDGFTLTDPDGYVVQFSNSHVAGPV